MKRLISAMMALCLLVACLGTLAQAAETYPFTGYVTTDKVYFRSGPSTQSASYGQLSRGAAVRVTGEKGGFYAVTYQSRSGYILKSLVTRNFIPPVGDGSAYICKDKVYFRKAASQDSAYFCQLDLGTKVTVTGETGNYYAVKYGKDAGYIRKDCLSFTQVQGGKAAAAVTPAPAAYAKRTGYISQQNVYFRKTASSGEYWSQLPLGTQVTVTGETGNYYSVSYSGKNGYIRKDCLSFTKVTPAAAAAYGKRTGYISLADVNFRQSPSGDGAVFTQLPLGTQVTVTGETGNYYNVSYAGKNGYIRRDCLSFNRVTPAAAAPTAFAKKTGYISQQNVYFRKTASSGEYWGQLALGTQVTVTGEAGNYYSVTYNGKNGYIRKDCLSFTKVTPAGAVPTAYAKKTGYISQQNVYFRKTASAGDYWGQLALGTQVTVTGEMGNYYSVTYSGKNGYIRKDCLSFTKVTPAGAAPTAYAKKTGYICQPNVYFRKTASAGDYWGQLALGAQVIVTGETGNYYSVTYGGRNGYIRKDCLSFVKVTPAGAVAPAATPFARKIGYISQVNVYFRKTASAGDYWELLALGTQVIVTGETGNYYSVTYGGRNGYIRKDCLSFAKVTAPAPTITAFVRRTGYISQVNVNFRQSPSADSGAHCQLPLGTQVTVTGETGNYYCVTWGGLNGYIRKDCLSFTKVTPRAATPTAFVKQTGYISQPNVYFRKTASAGDYWGQLALGTQVTVTGETGDYYSVTYGGYTGYIRKDCLSFTKVTPAAPTPTQYAARDGYISKDNVNFRQMPSADSASHFQLAMGTKVTVTGETGDYYQVTYAGLKGYIRKDCLSFAKVTPGTVVTPTPTATAYGFRDGYISKDNVNFRQMPSADSAAHCQLAMGTKVTVTGETGDYYQVTYGGLNGFIRKDCLSFVKVTPKATSTPTPAPTPYGSKVAYVSQVNVYFRKGPSTESDSYCQLALGTQVTVLGESGRFYQVLCDGNIGYIMKNCLSFNLVTPRATPSPTPVPTEYAPRTGYISEENVYFRKQPSPDDYYTQLAYATQVTVTGESGNYYKVTYSGYTGYIRKDCLSFTQVTPKASVTTPPPSVTYVTESLDWFGKGKNLFSSGATVQVKDCKTGKIWTCRVLYGSNHLDLEPLTAADTAAMTAAYGGNITYVRRPVLVKYEGHVYAGSIYGVAHGDQTIIDNNFDGQFCIHFTGSKTHGTDRVDADHQAAVQEAMGYTW